MGDCRKRGPSLVNRATVPYITCKPLTRNKESLISCKTITFSAVLIAAMFLVVLSVNAQPQAPMQNPNQGQPSIVQMLAPMLQQAGQPLTPGQIEKLSSLQMDANFQANLMKILTQEQVAVLQQASQQQQQQQGPTIFDILDQGGKPMSDAQMEKLEAIEPAPGARKKMMDLLTDEQIGVLRNYMENDAQGDNIPKVLNNAGEPLSNDQMRKINSIEPGPEAREQLDAILTGEQRDVLDEKEAESAK